jgi:hypothetical protein
VQKERRVEVLVWPIAAKEAALRHKVAAMQVYEDAPFTEGSDPDFGVTTRPDQAYALPVTQPVDPNPAHRVGDAYHPEGNGGGNQDKSHDTAPSEMLLHDSPEQLAQYAKDNDLPAVLDHGVMASLISTYDAVSAQEQYIDKLGEGLDALGRCLFLFWAKPADYEEAYGTDDMHAMENRMLSVFKSYGDVVLELLKRSRERQTNKPGL